MNEADPRHAEIISRDPGAEKLKTLSTPAAKDTGREAEEVKRQDLNERRLSGKLESKSDDDDNSDTLSADEVTRYRRIAARAKFFAQDRMDIAFATKEATRRMTSPTKEDWNKLVRIGRYFVRVVIELVQVPERIRGSCSLHRFRLGWVKINIRRVHPQRTAHA